MAGAWKVAQYLRFEGPRMQPVMDLLSRIQPSRQVREVVDLGCGAGNAMPHLASAFPGARVLGVDSSPSMLARAAEDLRDVSFPWSCEERDFADFDARCDVLFSNAALHWRPDDHDWLLPHLLGCVRPGGVLAVQVPDTRDQPSHHLLHPCAREAAGDPSLTAAVAQVRHGPEWYYRQLAGAGAEDVQVWRTEYVHPLRGDHPVADFLHSTALRPFFDALGGEDSPAGSAFLRLYRERTAAAYPPQPDGATLFPVRRLFFTARAPAPPAAE